MDSTLPYTFIFNNNYFITMAEISPSENWVDTYNFLLFSM